MSTPYEEEFPVGHPELGSGEVSYDPTKTIVHFGSMPTYPAPRPWRWWHRLFGIDR